MNISLVCASPSRYNTGMVSVDKAWDKFIEKYDFKVKTIKYRFNDICYDSNNQSYSCLIKDYNKFIDADKIVYWGDFLHMHRYHVRKANMLLKIGNFKDFPTALDEVQEKLLLKSKDEKIKSKSIAFGGNVLLEAIDDLVSKPHHELFIDFVKKSINFLPRDIYSANITSKLKDEPVYSQGIDCAMLNWSGRFTNNEFNDWLTEGTKVGIYFGRSIQKIPNMILFAKYLAKRMNMQTKWIPWLNEESGINKQNIVKKTSELVLINETNNYKSFATNLKHLRECKFIITDTYHMTVNAWCLGIPAICIGDIYRPRSQNVNSGSEFNWRDKRYMHYLMYDMLDFYVHQQELNSLSKSKKRIDHIIKSLNRNDKLLWIFENMKSQIKLSEEALINALKK